MLTPDEFRALAVITVLVTLGALLTWLDAEHPRVVALALGDSLALERAWNEDTAADSARTSEPVPSAGEGRRFAGGAARLPDSSHRGRDARGAGETSTPGPAGTGPAYTLDGRLDL